MTREPTIVERLRMHKHAEIGGRLMAEAAEEIERLKAALQAIERETGITMLATNHGRRGDLANTIARAALEPKP